MKGTVHECNLTEAQVLKMVQSISRNLADDMEGRAVKLVASDSYGDAKHRVWAFSIEGDRAMGTIERYWSGLKMVSTIAWGSPRTHFFLEDGMRTTNKEIKAMGAR